MGLKCSLLGHAYEPAEADRDRQKRGSEVVTVVREIERCRRCGDERVVSESTEVTAVVDESEVDLDGKAARGDAPDSAASDAPDGDDSTASGDGPDAESDAIAEESTDSGALGGIVGRSDIGGDDTDAPGGDESASEPDVDSVAESGPPPGPEADDAEILTDDPDSEREPGQWPEEAEADASEAAGADDSPLETTEPEPRDSEEDSLAGITVPEGMLACAECGFQVDAESSYRGGDPCPECGAWLTAERNR